MCMVFSSVFLSACISNKKPHEPLSKEKESELYQQMGVRYLEMNMLKEAKEKLEASVEADSNNSEGYNVLGVLYERLKQYEAAGTAYERAVNLNNDDASIFNNYGRFLCERGDYQSGMKYLKQALDLPLNNRKWFALTNIGRCELIQDDNALAEGYFRQALLKNKTYSPALLEMIKISYRTGKYMSVRAFVERYLAVSRHTSATLWHAMHAEKMLGNQQLSEKYKGQLINDFPVSDEAQKVINSAQKIRLNK